MKRNKTRIDKKVEPTLVMSDWLLCTMVVSDWLLRNRRSVIGHSEGHALHAGGASVKPALNLLNLQWSEVSEWAVLPHAHGPKLLKEISPVLRLGIVPSFFICT